MTTVSNKAGFLPANAQYRFWGISAETRDDQVRVRMGGDETTLTAGEAKSFALHLLRAMHRAEVIELARVARS